MFDRIGLKQDALINTYLSCTSIVHKENYRAHKTNSHYFNYDVEYQSLQIVVEVTFRYSCAYTSRVKTKHDYSDISSICVTDYHNR